MGGMFQRLIVGAEVEEGVGEGESRRGGGGEMGRERVRGWKTADEGVTGSEGGDGARRSSSDPSLFHRSACPRASPRAARLSLLSTHSTSTLTVVDRATSSAYRSSSYPSPSRVWHTPIMSALRKILIERIPFVIDSSNLVARWRTGDGSWST